MELLTQQLAGERAALEAERGRTAELSQQLSAEQEQVRAHLSTCATLRADCSQLRADLVDEQGQREAAETQVGKLHSQLALRTTELEAAEQRLTRHLLGTAARDEQLVQESQRLKEADEALIGELRHCIDQLKERLAEARYGVRARAALGRCSGRTCIDEPCAGSLAPCTRKEGLHSEGLAMVQTCRRDASEELRRQQAKLERETAQRERLELEAQQYREQLRQHEDSHSAAVTQLRRQVREEGTESVLEAGRAWGCSPVRLAESIDLPAQCHVGGGHAGVLLCYRRCACR